MAMKTTGVGRYLLCSRSSGIGFALLLATLSALAGAQAFPSKPIRWVVAFPPGGGPHLAIELLNSMAGARMTHVPYKGSGPGMTDLLAGHVQLTIDSVVQSLPYVKAGRLRAIAITGAKRTPLLPEVPTVGESLRGYDVTNWFGLVVPAATPPEIRARIHAE